MFIIQSISVISEPLKLNVCREIYTHGVIEQHNCDKTPGMTVFQA